MNYENWRAIDLNGLLRAEIITLYEEGMTLKESVRSPISLFYLLDARMNRRFSRDVTNWLREDCEEMLIGNSKDSAVQYGVVKRYIWRVNRELESSDREDKRYLLCLVGLANERLEELVDIPAGLKLALALPDCRLN